MAARDMVARHTRYADEFDDFPTPPWATRALIKYVLPIGARDTVLEPACGRGYMVKALQETGAKVTGRDINPRYKTQVQDFTEASDAGDFDYIITNPPYKMAEDFFNKARRAKKGCALLLRIQWLTGQNRYNRIFSVAPPHEIAVFSRRMPAAQGRVIRDGSPFFDHMWAVWRKDHIGSTHLIWIPPAAQVELEKESDYER